MQILKLNLHLEKRLRTAENLAVFLNHKIFCAIALSRSGGVIDVMNAYEYAKKIMESVN